MGIFKLYKKARKDKEFNEAFKANDSEYMEPTIFRGRKFRALFSMCYMGWLLARGRFNEDDYK